MLEQYNEILSVSELRQILGIGKGLAYTLLQSGEIRGIRIGEKKWRIPKSALIEYLNTV